MGIRPFLSCICIKHDCFFVACGGILYTTLHFGSFAWTLIEYNWYSRVILGEIYHSQYRYYCFQLINFLLSYSR